MSFCLRFMFVLLLALGLGERVMWYTAGAANRNPAAALAAGITSMGLKNFGEDQSGLLRVAAPGCPHLFPLSLTSLDGSEDARFTPLLDASNHPVFIYLGHAAPQRHSARVIAAWLTANAKTMLGLRRTQAPDKMVLAILPASCPGVETMNWGALSQ